MLKTKKIDSIRWPRELEKASEAAHTKAGDYSPNALRVSKDRKAYLEAKVAEVKALPNRDARIVGKGSYAEVAVYEVTEVAGATQYRGTCQVCGGAFSVGYDISKPVHLSLHGYQRPGYGYIVGECWGVNHPAAEVSVDLSKASIVRLRDGAATGKARAAKIIAKHILSDFAVRNAWVSRAEQVALKFSELKPEQQAKVLLSAAEDAERTAQQIEAHILPRLGRPFHEEVVAL